MYINFEQLLLKKLLGTITTEEEMDFDLWLKANPPYNEMYRAREKEWAEQQAEAPEFTLQNVPTKLQGGSRSAAYRRFLIPNIVALLLTIVAALLFYSGVSVSEVSDRNIVAGNKARSVILNDSTIISLKPNSSITVPSGFHLTRTLTLEGQAYFNVKHLPGKPLVINTRNGRIETSGSSFVVLASEQKNENEVLVFDGRARLSGKLNPNKNVIVTPGMRAKVVNQTDQPTLTRADTVNLAGWKTDRLAFRNSTLYDVANIIASYYGVDVHVQDGLTGCRFTATFNLVTLDEVLDALRESIPVQVSSDQNTITLDAGACSD
jgi:transmembrane sensor